MFQSTWRKSSPASYFLKSANSTEEPRRVERRSPRIVPGKARRACILKRSSFLRKAGSRRLVFFSLIQSSAGRFDFTLPGQIAIGAHRFEHLIEYRITAYRVCFAFKVQDDSVTKRRFRDCDNVARAHVIASRQ